MTLHRDCERLREAWLEFVLRLSLADSYDSEIIVKSRLTENGQLYYHCPGCGHAHAIPVRQPELGKPQHTKVWTWNGSESDPDVSPSVRHFYDHPSKGQVTTCHYFIRNGEIHYCSDSQHDLAGKKIHMEDLE